MAGLLVFLGMGDWGLGIGNWGLGKYLAIQIAATQAKPTVAGVY